MKKKASRSSSSTKRAAAKKPAKSKTTAKARPATKAKAKAKAQTKTKTPTRPSAKPSSKTSARRPTARAKAKPVAKRAAPAAPPAQPVGISSEAVQSATGKTWAEWISILDARGADKMPHKEIAALLYEKLGVREWWCQMVTVGYEQARGLRQKNQKADGFSVTGSKTIAVPVGRLFDAWNDAGQRARWLPGVEFTVRKATPPKTMRITWVDGRTSVEVNFYPKGDDKSMVNVQHSKLEAAADVERLRDHWKAALENLRATLEG